MDEQLLAGRDALAIAAAMHLVCDVQPLAVDADDPDGQAQFLADDGLSQIAQVRLHRVDAAPRLAVGLVDADQAEQGIRSIPEDEQVGRLAHVAVVVRPGRYDRTRVHRKRRTDGRIWIPAGMGLSLEGSGHPTVVTHAQPFVDIPASSPKTEPSD